MTLSVQPGAILELIRKCVSYFLLLLLFCFVLTSVMCIIIHCMWQNPLLLKDALFYLDLGFSFHSFLYWWLITICDARVDDFHSKSFQGKMIRLSSIKCVYLSSQ